MGLIAVIEGIGTGVRHILTPRFIERPELDQANVIEPDLFILNGFVWPIGFVGRPQRAQLAVKRGYQGSTLLFVYR